MLYFASSGVHGFCQLSQQPIDVSITSCMIHTSFKKYIIILYIREKIAIDITFSATATVSPIQKVFPIVAQHLEDIYEEL